MVDEISNKTLAVLLIVAIALSLGGTLVSLNRLSSVVRAPGITGYATSSDTGFTNVSITSTAGITFTTSELDFGTGSVNTSASNKICTMASGATTGTKDTVAKCVGFNAAGDLDSLVIENYGNQDLSVTLNSSGTADTLFGGPENLEHFYWKVADNEASSCSAGLAPTTWTEVDATADTICTDFNFADASDTLYVHINITIPYDTTFIGTERKATITAEGTTV